MVLVGGTGAVSPAVEAQVRRLGLDTRRVSGPDRYATAVALVADAFPAGPRQLFVATGRDYPDALAGAAAAARVQAPLLLSEPGALPDQVDVAVRALAPERAVVLGGTAAVSDGVQTRLEQIVRLDVVRVSGPDRYATAADIAAAFFPTGVGAAYLTTGRNFPDALAAVPSAGVEEAPLLLTDPRCVPAATRVQADRLGVLDGGRLVVLGGTTAVSEAAATFTSCQPAVAAPPPAPPPPPPVATPPPVTPPTAGSSAARAAARQPGGQPQLQRLRHLRGGEGVVRPLLPGLRRRGPARRRRRPPAVRVAARWSLTARWRLVSPERRRRPAGRSSPG